MSTNLGTYSTRKAELVSLSDICHSPLKPSVNICNIQSIWAYWQDDPTELEAKKKRSVLYTYIYSDPTFVL